MSGPGPNKTGATSRQQGETALLWRPAPTGVQEGPSRAPGRTAMSEAATIEKPLTKGTVLSVRSLRRAAGNLHWVVTAILAAALAPAFHLAKLPIRINWSLLLSAYCLGLGTRSIIAASLLYVIAFPLRETLLPVWQHYCAQKPRFIVLALFAGAMFWEFGWCIGLILILDTVVFLEFFDRIGGDPVKLGRAARDLLAPAAYLFTGLVLVFCYNDLIASLKFAGSYDAAFNNLDAILLRGWTVSQLAHAAMRWLPLWDFRFLEFVYFGMFAQIGAALAITTLFFGKKRALAFVGTMVTAYYLALILFFLWPSMGPFAICPDHFSRLPGTLKMYSIQKTFLLKARLLSTHRLELVIDTDYYIGFPCMHIAQPLIVLWFLRKWKRITMALLAFDAVLVLAIFLLEQHYAVDLLGGVVVAILAIALVYPMTSENKTQHLTTSQYEARKN